MNERRAIDRRDRLLAIVAHDLRSPLQAIKLATNCARPSDPTTVVLQKAVSRMERMVDLLLDYARSRTPSGLPVIPRHADLSHILEDVIGELRAAHPGRELALDAAGDLWGDWDPDRIAQIVTNLVNNALKYGSPDTPVACLARRDGTHAILTVHNDGEPIPDADLRHLFDPFCRGQHDHDREGLGLGLYIVRAVVAAHGGEVRVHSNRAEGTTFTVTLPCHGQHP